MTDILKVEGLSAGYGPLRVLHDLDLVIHPGERVGIVGLNGHGKTTLFYAIAGLTGWQRGSILLNGRQIGRTVSRPAAVRCSSKCGTASIAAVRRCNTFAAPLEDSRTAPHRTARDEGSDRT